MEHAPMNGNKQAGQLFSQDEMLLLRSLIADARNILLATHTNPDGDAIGSILAMYRYLVKKGKRVSMVVPDPFPDYLTWMPGSEKIVIFSREPEKVGQPVRSADLLFFMDFNSLSRLDKAADLFREAKGIRVLIDHHPNPSDEFNHHFTTIQTSSTAELVYQIIIESGDQAFLDKDIAACIYAGIITDTGSFSYSCNLVNTYEVTADLFRLGIDGEYIHKLIYNAFSESRLRLLGFCLGERLVVKKEYCTAYIYLSKEDLIRHHYQVGDTEDVVNYALSINGIKLAALFTEKQYFIRLSLRSKGKFSVNDLARKYFDGGGHRNAAGANSYLSLEETLKKFESILPSIKSELACE
ncbi:MAG: bifunctional oligoribonuclease/PAP phosphatase NrnA [Bacteroidetes bacterium]|nr:bifunctional oligoribonuclease/PAP phosphatase NrnA [Bacteroidota bacterium]